MTQKAPAQRKAGFVTGQRDRQSRDTELSFDFLFQYSQRPVRQLVNDSVIFARQEDEVRRPGIDVDVPDEQIVEHYVGFGVLPRIPPVSHVRHIASDGDFLRDTYVLLRLCR